MSIKNPLAYLRKHAPKTYEALGEFAEKESQKFSDVNPWCDAPDSMLGKVLAFSTEACLQLSLPSDIKRYLDHSAAMRLRKYGLDRALLFIESRSKAAHVALAVLPEPFYRVNTEFKCARLADELAGRAHMNFQIACDKGMTPLEAVKLINEFVGLGLWMPQMLPREGKDDDVYFGIIGRAIDAAVWKRAITRQVTAAFENARRAAGMVSSHTSPYASYSACQWLKDRQKQQTAWLEMMMVENELGEQFSMKDVHDASVANPVNRRNELMTRMSGCQEYADEQAHVAVFVTMTSPGKYHRLKKRGNFWIENPNWNQTGAKAAHEWLSLSWERFRSAAGRRGLDYYGMRVVEPHVDGTPHWHAVFFMPLEQFATFSALLRHYQMQRDAEELYFPDGMPKTKAMKARIDIKLIDPSKGDAVAYIAKYISKNIDGFGLGDASDLDAKTVKLTEVVNNVTAWSRTFSFRQFQFQKVPSVTVWRELRRIQDKQEYSLFEKARRAADWGFFSAYFDYMGGHRVKQSQRPIKPYKKLDENRYGEAIEKIIGLYSASGIVFTHEHEWRLVKADAPKALDSDSLALGSSPALPWTCVNNCTQLEPSKLYNRLHPIEGHSGKPLIQSIRI